MPGQVPRNCSGLPARVLGGCERKHSPDEILYQVIGSGEVLLGAK